MPNPSPHCFSNFSGKTCLASTRNILGGALSGHFETLRLAQILNEDSAVECGPMFESSFMDWIFGTMGEARFIMLSGTTEAAFTYSGSVEGTGKTKWPS